MNSTRRREHRFLPGQPGRLTQVFVAPRKMVYLIDIHTLDERAFSTLSSTGKTLRAILGCPCVLKVFFDVRNDSDALHAQYGIKLAGIRDLEVMEFAGRELYTLYLGGLAACIQLDAGMTPAENQHWTSVKSKGKRLFAPECGGRQEAFNVRPLCRELLDYCVPDVDIMSRLYDASKLTLEKSIKAIKNWKKKVADSQAKGYNGKGRHITRGPW